MQLILLKISIPPVMLLKSPWLQLFLPNKIVFLILNTLIQMMSCMR